MFRNFYEIDMTPKLLGTFGFVDAKDFLFQKLYPISRFIGDIKGCDDHIEKFVELHCKQKSLNDFLLNIGIPNQSIVSIFSDQSGKNIISSTTLIKERNKHLRLNIFLKFDPINPDSLELGHIEMLNQSGSNYTGSGIGTRVIYSICKGALNLGLKNFDLIALKGAKNNGYYTWPRLGFDKEFNEVEIRTFRNVMKRNSDLPIDEIRYVSDFMRTKEGRVFWRKYGIALPLTFDLQGDSDSWATLNAYLREKRINITQFCP
jgi:hypothetical protein